MDDIINPGRSYKIFFTWILQTSWQAAVLVLLILLAHGLFGKWLLG